MLCWVSSEREERSVTHCYSFREMSVMMGGRITQRGIPLWVRVAFTETRGVIHPPRAPQGW